MEAEQSRPGAGDRIDGDGAAADATADARSVSDDAADVRAVDDGEARGAAPKPAPPRPAAEQPNIPVVPFDETDAAWGEYPQDSDDWLRQQRPPHHGG